jgi:hypothetical protein
MKRCLKQQLIIFQQKISWVLGRFKESKLPNFNDVDIRYVTCN